MAGRIQKPQNDDATSVIRHLHDPARSELTDRQRAILDMIRVTTLERGYPPSVREIGDSVGLNSPSSVAH
ncbi:MAG TPA: repressor LexA, partial [Actinobacteria bacterium]|nr:repressor LexA [Actinomycetota bacterium]